MTRDGSPATGSVPLPPPGDPARPMSVTRSVLVLGSLSVFGPLSMDLYMPQLPQLAEHLDTSDALAQVTMSSCMLALGLGQIFIGPLSDRIGRRRPLLVGVALFALLSVACAFAPTIEILIVLRFLQGLAGAAGMVVAMATARDMFNASELSRMLSLLSLVSSAAPIIAPVIGGQLALFMDWRGIFLVLAGIGGALFCIAAIFLRETLPPERRHSGGVVLLASQFGAVMRDRVFLMVVLIGALSSTAAFAYLSMSSFVYQNEFALSPALFSLVFAANSVAVMVGAQINGFFVRRVGARRMYLISFTAASIASIFLLAVGLTGFGGAALFIVAVSAVMFARGGSNPNGTSIALHDHGSRAGTAASVLGMTNFAIGPIIVPLLSLAGATTVAMSATMAVFTVPCAVLAWFVLRPMLIRRGR